MNLILTGFAKMQTHIPLYRWSEAMADRKQVAMCICHPAGFGMKTDLPDVADYTVKRGLGTKFYKSRWNSQAGGGILCRSFFFFSIHFSIKIWNCKGSFKRIAKYCHHKGDGYKTFWDR
jgi:hypothetical protein